MASNDDAAIYADPQYLSKIQEKEYRGYFRALFEAALQPYLEPSSAILDFGAGTCHYQKFLTELGYCNVSSLEVNHLRAFAANQLGLNNLFATPAELGDRRFDLVYANQTIEHIYDPVTLVEETLAPLIVPGGRFVFSVPNYASLNRVVLGKRWIGWSREHIWFFDASSVRKVFAASTTYTVDATLVKSAVNEPYDRFRPSSLVKRAYYHSFMRFFVWLGRGDQLIVVLRKRSAA